MPQRAKAASTEVDAYIFIKRKLDELGWNTRNPERNDEGQVWTQNQCLSNPHLKAHLGLDRPENIVKVTEQHLWVIEAKRSHGQIGQALDEARGYAAKLNHGCRHRVSIISGVAGNEDDGYIVTSQLIVDGDWQNVQINGIDTTGLLSESECLKLIESGDPNLEDPPINEALFIKTAERINKTLHTGAVNTHERAKVVSALLLAMLTGSGPRIEERDTSLLVQDINNRAALVLRRQGKQSFDDHIRLLLPAAEDNHVKLRRALVETLQDLRGLNIHSAMKSGADWLGTFYEVFLKYARWAQNLGIVFTPRHITRFAARAIGIGPHDIVYDPTCGTGGFLVAAFEEVKRSCGPNQIEDFKRHSVFGLEQDDGIAALAIVNMIFRGDGKNNIEQANCFAQHVVSARGSNGVRTAKFTKAAPATAASAPVTRVLMNPPFSLDRDKEYHFVNHALAQMVEGGRLFCILPYSVMAKSGQAKIWRENLLKEHTLLSVVTLPIDIFYPVSAPPVGVFIKQGVAHDHDKPVLWVRAETDGHLKSKGKRLPSPLTTDHLEDCLPIVRAFLDNPDITIASRPRFIVAAQINANDDLMELVPEAYLEQEPLAHHDVRYGIENVLKDATAFLVRKRSYIEALLADMHQDMLRRSTTPTLPVAFHTDGWIERRLDEIFELQRGDFHSLKNLAGGPVATVSRTETHNGVVGYFERPDRSTLHPIGLVTVSTVTGDAFVQMEQFQATDNVVILMPRHPMRRTTAYLVAAMINSQKWRYSYGRQPYIGKLSALTIALPWHGETLDEDAIESAVKSQPYWQFIETNIKSDESP